MNSIKYVGLDVHQSTISVAVLNAEGKLVMQCVLATQARAIMEFFQGLRGAIHVTFEEGSQSAWLYDLLARRVSKLVVCNPRKNALLKAGNSSFLKSERLYSDRSSSEWPLGFFIEVSFTTRRATSANSNKQKPHPAKRWRDGAHTKFVQAPAITRGYLINRFGSMYLTQSPRDIDGRGC